MPAAAVQSARWKRLGWPPQQPVSGLERSGAADPHRNRFLKQTWPSLAPREPDSPTSEALGLNSQYTLIAHGSRVARRPTSMTNVGRFVSGAGRRRLEV